MNLPELMSKLSATPWVIILLLVLMAVHTVTLVIYLLTSRASSTQKKQLSKASMDFLQKFENCLITTLPYLSEALKTELMNRGLLTMQEENQTEPEPEVLPEQEQSQEPQLVQQIMEVISNYGNTSKH